MEFLPVGLRDPAVLRRLMFAAVFLPKELPDYWSGITQFIGQEAETKESVRVAVENLDVLHSAAFSTDSALASEMRTLCSEKPGSQPLGIILIPSNLQCSKCGGKLHVKSDRPSRVTIYTEPLGTVVGTHYHKVCQNFRKSCAFRQYYRYSSEGSQSITYYDMDWESNSYFMSSSETSFELGMLQKFDAELLLGQISYSQRAEIYNYSHRYPVQPKTCSKLEMPERLDKIIIRYCMIIFYFLDVEEVKSSWCHKYDLTVDDLRQLT